MSKLQHTPGPWEFTGSMHMNAYLVGGGNRYVCSVWDHLREDDNGHPIDMYEEMQANARLIAAAPEMLEALILGALAARKTNFTATALESLIEKATGMSIEEVLSKRPVSAPTAK
jgi:hypothetical protein